MVLVEFAVVYFTRRSVIAFSNIVIAIQALIRASRTFNSVFQMRSRNTLLWGKADLLIWNAA